MTESKHDTVVVTQQTNLPTMNEAQTQPLSVWTRVLTDAAMFDRIMQTANLMAKGGVTVPKHLRERPSDCFAIVVQSLEWGMSPYGVAQKTFFVDDKIGYEAQLIAAAIVTSGAIREGALAYSWDGDWNRVSKTKEVQSDKRQDKDGKPLKFRVRDWSDDDELGLSVTVSGTLRNERTPRSLTLFLSQARLRNSTLWAEDPKQQLAYRAAKRWASLYSPGVVLGAYGVDDFSDSGDIYEGEANVVREPSRSPPAAGRTSRAEAVKDKLRKGATSRTTVPVDGEEVVVDAELSKIARVPEFDAAQNVAELTSLMNSYSTADRATHREAFMQRLGELRTATELAKEEAARGAAPPTNGDVAPATD